MKYKNEVDLSTYRVVITEIVNTTIEMQAPSKEEAEKMVLKGYYFPKEIINKNSYIQNLAVALK